MPSPRRLKVGGRLRFVSLAEEWSRLPSSFTQGLEVNFMANGKRGDHPVTDILDHGLTVFSTEASTLVRELAELLPRYRLYDLIDWLSPPPVSELTDRLRKARDDLRQQAKDRGWETR